MLKDEKKLLIMKFGGTSVGSETAIRQTAQIIYQYSRNARLVVVVSAMSGVTNLLLTCAHAAARREWPSVQNCIDIIRKKHQDVIYNLDLAVNTRECLEAEIEGFIGQLERTCGSIADQDEATPQDMDAVASLGERMNARLVSTMLEKTGIESRAVDADHLIVTDSAFQNASPIRKDTRKKVQREILPALKNGIVPVVTGFFGATREGLVTTLGRGGSDFSAAILGDALDADEVWTWTDVDGVMTADPTIVENARVIKNLNFDEASEIAYFGAKVLHPKTMRPLIEKNIPIQVKNTFNAEAEGTWISGNVEQRPGKISCVTAIREVCLITLQGRGMQGVPGVAARTFAAVASEKASVLMISQSSSEQSICFVIPKTDVNQVVMALENNLSLELERRDIDAVSVMRDVVIVTAIGAGMRHTPGVSARIFKALGESDINVIAIAQGSSEYSISLIVSSTDADQAVRQIHKEVIINGQKE